VPRHGDTDDEGLKAGHDRSLAGRMPIITVSHKDTAPANVLQALRLGLPAIVSQALACAEEPYDGRLKRGDVNIKFLRALSADEELEYLVEIRTGWTESRVANLDERVARIRSDLGELGLKNFGVWVETPPAAWAQD
jgi:hypothetical protein